MTVDMDFHPVERKQVFIYSGQWKASSILDHLLSTRIGSHIAAVVGQVVVRSGSETLNGRHFAEYFLDCAACLIWDDGNLWRDDDIFLWKDLSSIYKSLICCRDVDAIRGSADQSFVTIESTAACKRWVLTGTSWTCALP